MAGILHVLRTGISWQQLPTAAFGISGSTCWRRLAQWQEQGVWQRLHEVLLSELRAAGQLVLAYAVVDSSHVRAIKGGLRRSQPGRPGPGLSQERCNWSRHAEPAGLAGKDW